ncbi:hypothetical protein DPMN_194034 [Dreissena polymorpha]|uniref:Uncharacterized protein n=1 Tax=Dreissena polymorpha TaxID=45954 RepID=A0A9D3Y3Q9_DREPO|nr:hypothetical protein DPMN_194034 [Dreissena polymorpha]
MSVRVLEVTAGAALEVAINSESQNVYRSLIDGAGVVVVLKGLLYYIIKEKANRAGERIYY